MYVVAFKLLSEAHNNNVNYTYPVNISDLCDNIFNDGFRKEVYCFYQKSTEDDSKAFNKIILK